MNVLTLSIILSTVLAACFMLSYYLLYKLAEQKIILVNIFIVSSIATLTDAFITIGLCYLLSNQSMLIVASFIWGITIGSVCGISNYKINYKRKKYKGD